MTYKGWDAIKTNQPSFSFWLNDNFKTNINAFKVKKQQQNSPIIKKIYYLSLLKLKLTKKILD